MFDGHNLGVKRQLSSLRIDQQVEELDRLRRQLAQTVNGGLQAEAIAKGALTVARTIVEEQRAEQAGKSNARRLSDPANVEERNRALAQAAAKELSRSNVRPKPGFEEELAKTRKLK